MGAREVARTLARASAARARASATSSSVGAREMELAVRTRRRWASSTSTQRYRSTPSASSSKPGSLETAREVSDEETLPAASMSGWRRLALTLGGYFSEESRHVRGGERLYAEVKAASSEDALYAAHGIERTFARDHAVTCLHVWMCLQRLRREGEDGKDFSQIFYDAFQDDVERRVHDAGVRVRVRKWLQDLERTFYGNAVSYDKALELGGSELARALHRNVYDGDGDVDKAKALERYVRHHVASLAITPTSAVIDGRIRFQRFN